MTVTLEVGLNQSCQLLKYTLPYSLFLNANLTRNRNRIRKPNLITFTLGSLDSVSEKKSCKMSKKCQQQTPPFSGNQINYPL
jgi:hypothetical protein